MKSRDLRIKNFIKKYKIKTIEDVTKEKDNINNEINNNLEILKKKTIDLNHKNETYNLIKNIKDKLNSLKLIKKLYDDFINDRKYKYNVVIFLKSNSIKSFEVYEDKDIKGFKYKDEYYNINSRTIIIQNNKPFLFYLEGNPASIDFMNSKIDDIDKNTILSLNGSNIIDLIDGKAFKGIANLGVKDDGFWKFFDWKMGVIMLIIIVLTYLHLTGQVDLVSMIGFK